MGRENYVGMKYTEYSFRISADERDTYQCYLNNYDNPKALQSFREVSRHVHPVQIYFAQWASPPRPMSLIYVSSSFRPKRTIHSRYVYLLLSVTPGPLTT